MQSTFKPALVLMAGRALGAVVMFGLPLVLVRLFDQAAFGTYKQLFLIYGTLFGIAQVGMAESLYYFLPQAGRNGGSYVVNSMLALVAAGLACLALLAAAGTSIAEWMNNHELSRYLLLLGLHLWLMLAAEAAERVMITRRRYVMASCYYGVSDLLRAGFLIIPVLLLPRLDWLLMGAVAFSALRLGAALVYLRHEFKDNLHPDLALLKQQLAYAVPFELAVLAEITQANVHQYFVSYHFDAATFAIYAVGCLQLPVVDFLAGPACNVMMVRMTEEIRDGRGHSALAMWHDTTRKLALAFFPLAGLLIVNAHEIIVLLFTESYRASVPIFMIWSTVIVWSVLQTDGVLRVYAQTRYLLVLNVIRLLLIAASINWFLSRYQLQGAVFVTLLAIAVGKGLALLRMKRLMHVGFSEVAPWRVLAGILAAAAVAGLVALEVKTKLHLGGPGLLVTTSLVYIASYLPLVAGFHLLRLRHDERLALKGWLHNWAARLVRA